MTTVYKVTDKNSCTYGGYKWVPGEWHETDGTGDLCGPGWLHGYDHPLIAVLHDPIHGNYTDYLLWMGEGGGRRRDDSGLKCGYTRMRILTQLPVPVVTTEQRVRYAIGAALAVYPDRQYVRWARGWLTGLDRTAAASMTRVRAAMADAKTMDAAAERVAWAVTAGVVESETAAAAAAAWAVTAVAWTHAAINLIAIAEWAVTDSTTPPVLAGPA